MKKRGFSSALSQKCDRCCDLLYNQQFYLFPCSHGFHCDCLSKNVVKFMGESKAFKLRNLEDQLKLLLSRKDFSDKKVTAQIELLQNEIDGYIGADCPLCGNIMIETLSLPLITIDDEVEATSWAL